MKITSGVEMLVTDPKNEDNRSVREIRILLDDLAAGDELLPTDDEISTWENVLREDDEKWMDINFEDFERELDGKRKAQTADKPGTFGPLPPSGFGDANTQADLKKMVERFETFLNNDEADMDGVDVDDMDIDNDDDDSDEDSDDEDKAMSFDEAEFSRMMREMMGLPADEETINPKSTETDPGKLSNDRRLEELDSDDGDEEEEIQKLMKGMEAELNEAGALNLNPAPKMSGSGTSLRRATDDGEQEDNESSDDEDVNIDFNLAKNLLESFKSQAGMPGPGGNLLGLMGLQLPRDEDDEQQPTGI
ncbi:putative protein SGT1 like protein [Glarea lozoyensis 74030]|uniref:Protein SGT1 n=1 Tax=Glarea lozoyensis (strain ATCC 74030 / MF5533) TaxID=1104152 RepID=H0ELC8_GLAL7|nr:putative protein SGT1 like protein [Glarea lozoyensis 74030]